MITRCIVNAKRYRSARGGLGDSSRLGHLGRVTDVGEYSLCAGTMCVVQTRCDRVELAHELVVRRHGIEIMNRHFIKHPEEVIHGVGSGWIPHCLEDRGEEERRVSFLHSLAEQIPKTLPSILAVRRDVHPGHVVVLDLFTIDVTAAP